MFCEREKDDMNIGVRAGKESYKGSKYGTATVGETQESLCSVKGDDGMKKQDGVDLENEVSPQKVKTGLDGRFTVQVP